MDLSNNHMELEYYDNDCNGFIKVNLLKLIENSKYLVEDNSRKQLEISDKSYLRIVCAFNKLTYEVDDVVEYKNSNNTNTNIIWKEGKVEEVNGEIITLVDRNNEVIITRKKHLRTVKTFPIENFEITVNSDKSIDTERVKSVIKAVDVLKENNYFIEIGENYLRCFNYKPFISVTENSDDENKFIEGVLKTIVRNEEMLSA
jgi:hypothetical protein